MGGLYFNYHIRLAENWFDRGSFVRNWWRIYAHDPHWTPPSYPFFRREMEPENNSHLARLNPVFISLEALPGKPNPPAITPYSNAGSILGGTFEEPVAAALALQDPRRQDGTAYLALLHCVNDNESLERLIEALAEQLAPAGVIKLLGVTGISPHLGSGLLEDTWNQDPPFYTAYNPPYLPELIPDRFRPVLESRLYFLEEGVRMSVGGSSEVLLETIEARRLADDLFPLFTGCFPDPGRFPPPDREEAAFLLRQVNPWPHKAWLARMEGQQAGFLVVCPDLATQFRQAKGGRGFTRRIWLAWATRQQVLQGRIVFGGVHPHWRRRGIGGKLLDQAIFYAREQGWQALTIGPLDPQTDTARFLERHGAQPRQTYRLYELEIL